MFAATVQLARLIRFRRDFAAEGERGGERDLRGKLARRSLLLSPRLCPPAGGQCRLVSLSHVGLPFRGLRSRSVDGR